MVICYVVRNAMPYHGEKSNEMGKIVAGSERQLFLPLILSFVCYQSAEIIQSNARENAPLTSGLFRKSCPLLTKSCKETSKRNFMLD